MSSLLLTQTFYEIITVGPYKELSDAKVRDAFAEGCFPYKDYLSAFKDIIAKCWKQEYRHAE